MKPCELQTILSREFQEHGMYVPCYIMPEARWITGNPKHDAQLHRILVEYGIEVDLNPRHHMLEGYRVVDDQKFMMFLLRWS
jgi:hypothetical protein